MKGQVRLTDYGLARDAPDVDPEAPVFDRSRELMSTAVQGTLSYRAPELLLGDISSHEAIDIWSVGCVFAELLSSASGNERILFHSGRHDTPLEQIHTIFRVLGTPAEEELHGIRRHVEDWTVSAQLALSKFQYSKENLADKFPPSTDTYALDLLEGMLQYDRRKRISLKDALAHKYFESVRVESAEFRCPTRFPFRIDHIRREFDVPPDEDITPAVWKRAIFQVIMDWYHGKGFTDDPQFS